MKRNRSKAWNWVLTLTFVVVMLLGMTVAVSAAESYDSVRINAAGSDGIFLEDGDEVNIFGKTLLIDQDPYVPTSVITIQWEAWNKKVNCRFSYNDNGQGCEASITGGNLNDGQWHIAAAAQGTYVLTWVAFHTHDGVTFKPWTKSDGLPDTEGNYYLTEDVTLSNTWTVPEGKTSLCLNGHGIKFNGTCVINIESNRTLNLYDCDTSTKHSFTVSDGLATIDDTFNENNQTFTGGYITGGNNSGNGAGVRASGTFNMYGGTIIGNNGYIGGGVNVASGATFNMNGGSIMYNTASRSGGGVNTVDTVNIKGGSIENNTAGVDGGGVNIGMNGKLNMTGGLITENTANGSEGGGVWVSSGGQFTVSGAPKITRNTTKNATKNVFLPSTSKITVNGSLKGEDDSKANIGVTMKSSDVFTSGWSTKMESTSNPADYFFSDNSDYGVTLTTGEKPEAQLLSSTKSYPLWVGGTQVTSGNADDVFGDGKVKFTPAKAATDGSEATPAILSLNGYKCEDFSTTSNDYDGVIYYAGTDSLTLKLTGENIVSAGAGTGMNGIACGEALLIKGEGSLRAKGANGAEGIKDTAPTKGSDGIVTNGVLTVESGEIEASGGTGGKGADLVIVNGVQYEAQNGEPGGIGVRAALNMKGGTLHAKGGAGGATGNHAFTQQQQGGNGGAGIDGTMKMTGGICYAEGGGGGEATFSFCNGAASRAVTGKITFDNPISAEESADNTSWSALTSGSTSEKQYVRAGTHQHSFTYAAGTGSKVNTIIATCEGAFDCSADYKTKPITLTLNAPTDLTYNNSAKAASISGYPSSVVQNLAAAPTTVAYYKTDSKGSTTPAGTALSGAPTDAGNYVAQTTWGGQTASVAFSIAQATPVITTAPSASVITYGQTLASSTLSSGKAGISGTTTEVPGTFTWTDDTIAPAVSDSGKTKYGVTFTPTDDTNCAAATTEITLTVNKADITPTVSIEGWNYGSAANTPAVSDNPDGTKAGDGNVTFWYKQKDAPDSAYTKDVPTDADQYTLKAEVAATDNYNAAVTAPVNFTISPIDMQVTSSDYNGVYDGAGHSITVNAPEGATVTYEKAGGTWTGDNPAFAEVGEYDVAFKVTLKNYNEFAGSQKVIITQAPNTVSVSIEGWTYGEQAKAPQARADFGADTAVFTYSNAPDGDYGAEVPTQAGLWYVKAAVAETKNYAGAESAPVEFSIGKADQAAPAAPSKAGVTTTSITLAETAGCEYSMDASAWQDSPAFASLSPDTEYTFYQRLKEDANHNASQPSKATKIRTSAKPQPKTGIKKMKPKAVKAKGKTKLVICWCTVDGAKGYDIFFAKCGKDTKCTKIKTIKGNKKFSWTKKDLKPNKPYKAYVKAWVKKSGKKKYIAKTPTFHIYTANETKHYTNAKSITVKKAKVSLKAGKTYKIKAKINKINENKKLMPACHTKQLRYMSSNEKIATVDGSGRITAKSAGTCKVYVFAANGVNKAIKVTVVRK